MNVLIILAPGFEEVEALAVADVLRRADVTVTLAGTTDGLIEGRNRIRVSPDETLESVKGNTYDLIVLPGGMPGTTNLKSDPRVMEMIKRHQAADKYLAAICAAPTVLKEAKLTAGKKIACHPSVEREFENVVRERVVADGRIITSRGPGTAIELGLKLVEILCGRERSERIKTAIVA